MGMAGGQLIVALGVGLLLMGMRAAAAGADSSPFVGSFCGNPYSDNSTRSSINAVLTDLVTRASVGGFATSARRTIYGLAQCRGDVAAADCAACLRAAATQLPQVCPQQADARVWYDYCLMRYDNTNFIGQPDTGPAVILYNTQEAPQPEKFKKAVSKLMTKADAAAVAPGGGFLGRAKAAFLPDITIYGMGWCTRDLTALSCAQCLSTGLAQFPTYCRAQQGCQISYSSCVVRYEIYPFFFPIDRAAAAAAGQYVKVVVGDKN